MLLQDSKSSVCKFPDCGKKIWQRNATGYCRTHRHLDPETIQRRNGRYWANPEIHRARTAKYRLENPEKAAAAKYKWLREKGRYNRLVSRGKEREIEVSLTRDQYDTLVLGASCSYCMEPLPKEGVGLDRIDNDKGYSLDNVLPCCGDCNYLRQDLLTPEETLQVVQFLAVLRGKDSPWTQKK